MNCGTQCRALHLPSTTKSDSCQAASCSPALKPIELAFSKRKKLLRDGAERSVDELPALKRVCLTCVGPTHRRRLAQGHDVPNSMSIREFHATTAPDGLLPTGGQRLSLKQQSAQKTTQLPVVKSKPKRGHFSSRRGSDLHADIQPTVHGRATPSRRWQ